MGVYAVIKTGGKQYRVAPGDIVKVEKLALAPGATVEISDVFLLVNDGAVTAGNPAIPNARVTAEVIEEGRDRKVLVFKIRRRKNYRRTIGHRQHFTLLKISEIAHGDAVYRPQAGRPIAAPRAAEASPAARPASAPAVTKGPPLSSPAPAAAPPKPIGIPGAAPPTQGAPAKSAPPAPSGSVEPPKKPSPTSHAPAAPVASTPSPPPRPAIPEHRVDARTPASTPPPSRADAVPTPASPPPAARAEPRRRHEPPPASLSKTEAPARYDRRILAVVALLVLLLAVIGFILTGRDEQVREEAVPVAVPPPEQAVKPRPAPRDAATKKPAAVTAPSAPAQPPD